MGIVSCLGNALGEVADALSTGRSGIRRVEEYERAGLRSLVGGIPSVANEPPIDRRLRRFMGETAIYAHHALRKAIEDAALAPEEVSNPRAGLVLGAGVGSLGRYAAALEAYRKGGARKVPPYGVMQTMTSSASASLASAFSIRGPSYSLSSACASSAHAIGHGAELIRSGRLDIVLVGGSDEAGWTSAVLFDAMGALSTGFNNTPRTASRPYSAARDGFVMAGGAGMLVLEAMDRAHARNARIHAEFSGYGASSGGDMILPEPAPIADAIRIALIDAGGAHPGYVNTHATSTSTDFAELAALRAVFGANMPPVSSTKGQTGHSIGASGAQEAIYSLLMMNGGFLAGCSNLEDPDPLSAGFPLLDRRVKRTVDSVMSNSLGFGGTNASLIFSKV